MPLHHMGSDNLDLFSGTPTPPLTNPFDPSRDGPMVTKVYLDQRLAKIQQSTSLDRTFKWVTIAAITCMIVVTVQAVADTVSCNVTPECAQVRYGQN